MAWAFEMPTAASVAAPAPSVAPEATVALFLNSGGDERITADPHTGRTPYGTKTMPAEDEIWFSSSTATSIDPRGFAAAGEVVARLIGMRAGDAANVKSWFDQIRSRIVDLFAIPGSEAVLTPSGTEAEFAVLTVARALLQRPLTNIVVAPNETGNGVMLAAAGKHFLPSASLGGEFTVGTFLAGFAPTNVETKGIAIRDALGFPREPADIDREAATLVAQALASGRDVLLHVLDASKTGLPGVTRETALELAKQARGRIAVVVDACQLRCEPEQLQKDLESGFMVTMTGSKFAGGPPFSGALLLSPSTIERLVVKNGVPAGLSTFSARLDWPDCLRLDFAKDLDTPVNLGLGLRWEAALAVIEPYFALQGALRRQILTWFAGSVHRRVSARPHLRLVPAAPSRSKTIIPVETAGQHATPAGAAALHAALADAHAPMGAPLKLAKVCHVGQPVPIGERAALRICASMPLVLDIAERIMQGDRIDDAVAPVLEDLDLLFEKWDWLART
jgi:hypothetical protein